MAATTPPEAQPALTPQRVAELSALARKIDAEEQDELKRIGRASMRHRETVTALLARLKAERMGRGLTLTEVGRRSGLGTTDLSRLENDSSPNPTVETLLRYAEAIGVELAVTIDR